MHTPVAGHKQSLKKDYYIVLPSYNESKYIGEVLDKVKKITSNIIVVDDGSRDDTYSIAKEKVQYVLRHTLNLGKGAALKTGCDFAFETLHAEAVIVMDSDAQHDPDELKNFVEQLEAGHQLVFGVRRMRKKMPKIRVLANKFASILVYSFFGGYIPDIPSGYKAFSREGYEKIRWVSRGYEVEMEIAARTAQQKLDFVCIPIKTIYLDTDKGMTFIDAGYMMFQMLLWKLHL